ncbi:alpha/beta hydrolase fold domain-containing protein [Agromyces sp. Marseille-Q5079]|uniref:alpha/beta hydrolase fold domain-containing protein n=1 Tax=Agromyces sp. Marseille-Q5079 TaxID=3439059 RepID=UPI003D9CBB9B
MRELVFAEAGGRPLRLDLHLPTTAPDAQSALLPVIVFVHGGGWRTGTRHEFGPDVDRAFERIADAGFAVASVEYRLSGEAVFPAQVDDVAAAVRWVATEGERVGLDPARVVLWGESAGAALAALAVLRADAATRAHPATRGVIDWYGPTDLPALGVDLGRLDDPDCAEGRWLGGTIAGSPEAAVAASAARQVAPAVAAGLALPPFLIAHGTADASVPPAQGALLAAELRRAGGEVQFDLVDGAGHRFVGESGSPAVDRDALFERALAFARRVLGGSPG